MTPDIDKVIENVIAGYKRGAEWDREWPPGGPWVYDEVTALYNDLWRFGWRTAMQDRKNDYKRPMAELARLLVHHYAFELESYLGRRTAECCPGCGKEYVFDEWQGESERLT